MNIPARGFLILSLATLHSSLLTLLALPPVRNEPCPACHGKRSLSLTPPNLGQFDGDISVTPGKPFKTHRFDFSHDTCPLCEGAGKHEHWTMARLPRPDGENLEPCTACLGTGVVPCQKCRKTGYAQCSKCKNQKKPGWILKEERTPGRTSRHTKKVVTPCGTCGGVGKVACPSCDSRGGTICKKCNGEGFVPRKERK